MRSSYTCYATTIASDNSMFLKTRTNPIHFGNFTPPPRDRLSFKTNKKSLRCSKTWKHENKNGSAGDVTRCSKTWKASKGNSSNGEQGEMEKRGTILGAVSLIVGTSIGSGILALPQKTSPAGFIPSAAAITMCWLFLVIEALLIAEINVHLRQRWKKGNMKGSCDLEVISLRTMAQETLGEWGANLATITYLFLAYTSMVAYTSKSGDVLSQLVNIPNSILGIIFTFVSALLVLVGGTNTTDRVNQWLTISMIALLLAIEIMALSFDGWSDSMAISNWEKVPQTIPVIIFSLVYHDIAPVICAYLGGDLPRIRISILFGSIVPFLSLLIWDGIALDFFPNLDGIDTFDFLVRGRWGNMVPIVQLFSILAVGTSLIGTLLGFSQFFMEQLTNLLPYFPSLNVLPIYFSFAAEKLGTIPKFKEKLNVNFQDGLENDKIRLESGRNWLQGNSLPLLAMSMAVLPSMLISIVVPDAFSVATDVAGGYCMMILYGVLPPVMAWTLHSKSAESDDTSKVKYVQLKVGRFALSKVKPLLIGVGVLSCGIVMEEVFMDLMLVDHQ